MDHHDEERPGNTGAPLVEPAGAPTGLWASDPTATYGQTPLAPAPEDQGRANPDRPAWGLGAAVSTWLISVGAIILVPAAALLVWLIVLLASGKIAPAGINAELITSPTSLLIQILSTMLAHLLTIAVCWAVVTKMGKRPFLQSVGWNWANRSPLFWTLFSGIVLGLLTLATAVLSRFLPQAEETPFTQLLKSGPAVRLAVVVLATTSAPLVEEIVYRGVLFGGLRKRLGVVPTVVIVTIAFTMVHGPQYKGAWVSMAGLTLLSLVLTGVRAWTHSILPCVWIHFLNNLFESVMILIGKS